ncbi:MAG: peptide-methionine (S)-S-oxide reductase, partial [Pedobacter sp.]|nr:peptide-methionine (S)-S-oxide reductase [Chitinophagaceae bacterium]
MSDTINTTETADFGAGCFWCVEAVFQRVEGVLSVT